MRHWLREPAGRDSTPHIIAKFLESEFGVYFFSYGGLIFDLAIGFLLVFKKTRLLGFGLLLVFNICNHWMFNIGVFPFLMIFATVIFLEPETPGKFIKKFFPQLKSHTDESKQEQFRYRKAAITFVSIYIIIQVLLPFRHWLYEGNVSWTEEGHLFSWHMKLRSKEKCGIYYEITNPKTGETWNIDPKSHLHKHHYNHVCREPSLTIRYAHYLGQTLEKQGVLNPVIKAGNLVSLNYRPPAPLIDSTVNLMDEEYSLFSQAKWILPLKE